MKHNTIKKLSDREHILLRSSMYIGAVTETEKEILFLVDDKFKFQTVKYNPGFLKIVDEILDNSIDEAIRTNFKFSTNIKISYNKATKEFTIEDDGRGLPQTLGADDLPMGVIAFTEARAGSNFSDDKANGIGLNGVGSYLTNCYSNRFDVVTCDGKNELTLNSINNAESFSYNIKAKKGKQGTKVSFVPDLARFGMTDISEVYLRLIENRCFHLSQSFPEIKFKLEGF